MKITPVRLRGGTLDGGIHRASTSYETWGLTRVPESTPALWELHVKRSGDKVEGLPVWDFERTLTECDLLDSE
jgi:hypothetical protein